MADPMLACIGRIALLGGFGGFGSQVLQESRRRVLMDTLSADWGGILLHYHYVGFSWHDLRRMVVHFVNSAKWKCPHWGTRQRPSAGTSATSHARRPPGCAADPVWKAGLRWGARCKATRQRGPDALEQDAAKDGHTSVAPSEQTPSRDRRQRDFAVFGKSNCCQNAQEDVT